LTLAAPKIAATDIADISNPLLLFFTIVTGIADVISTRGYYGHIHTKMNIKIVSKLYFGCSTYAQKDNEIIFLM
jgi:fumarate reductase subunit C